MEPNGSGTEPIQVVSNTIANNGSYGPDGTQME